jgi:hypothetical protein
VKNATLSIMLRYLGGQQPRKRFSYRSSSHVKCDIDRMHAMVEHISFGYPDDMQGLLNPLQLEAIMSLYGPMRSI